MPTQTIHTDDHGRLLAHVDLSKAGDSDDARMVHTDDVFASDQEPNLVSSRTLTGDHLPIFDFDFPCRLIESSTPGKFHLYLDGPTVSPLAWNRVLTALAAAGLVQEGWIGHMNDPVKSVFLRLPGVKKSQKQIDKEAKRAKLADAF
jgi:hypothetical protein